MPAVWLGSKEPCTKALSVVVLLRFCVRELRTLLTMWTSMDIVDSVDAADALDAATLSTPLIFHTAGSKYPKGP